MPKNSASLWWTGALQVQCPYFYYLTPKSAYPRRTACGVWLSHPRAGSCASPDPASPKKLGQGCTWQRLPTAQVVFGDQLLAAGWNRSSSFDDATGKRVDTTVQTMQNVRASPPQVIGVAMDWRSPYWGPHRPIVPPFVAVRVRSDVKTPALVAKH